MDLKDQICSCDQAKTLSDLGVIQGCSLFFYNTETNKIMFNQNAIDGYHNALSCFSAFTVAELGIMLPTAYDTVRFSVLENNFFVEKWFGYDYDEEDCPKPNQENGFNTEAQARAEMLIYLLKNNIIKVDEVNQRFST